MLVQLQYDNSKKSEKENPTHWTVCLGIYVGMYTGVYTVHKVCYQSIIMNCIFFIVLSYGWDYCLLIGFPCLWPHLNYWENVGMRVY